MKIILHLMFVILLTACSANQISLQTQLLPSISSSLFELKDSITIKATNAKSSTIRSGTKWLEVGSIDQGTVYRTKDQVVIVNSFDVHEGYIVVKESTVVGYYLPVEKTFVKSKPVLIKLKKMEQKNEV